MIKYKIDKYLNYSIFTILEQNFIDSTDISLIGVPFINYDRSNNGYNSFFYINKNITEVSKPYIDGYKVYIYGPPAFNTHDSICLGFESSYKQNKNNDDVIFKNCSSLMSMEDIKRLYTLFNNETKQYL